MTLRVLQTVQCSLLRVGKSLFKLISEPAQVERKGVFELKMLNFTVCDNLLTHTNIAGQKYSIL